MTQWIRSCGGLESFTTSSERGCFITAFGVAFFAHAAAVIDHQIRADTGRSSRRKTLMGCRTLLSEDLGKWVWQWQKGGS